MKSVHFEYMGEDIETPGATIWNVEAIHVTTTKNKRKFTMSELKESGRSLSFRPLDINHDFERLLDFPNNKTLHMNFNPDKMVVEGKMSILDKQTNFDIENGKIESVSIEQIPTRETCNEILCEQHGVAFIGLGLLEKGMTPGDGDAKIKGHAENKQIFREPIMNLLVSDEQRTCEECSDDIPCHTCIHAKKEFNEAVVKINEFINKSKEEYIGSREALISWAIEMVFPEGLNKVKAKTHFDLALKNYNSI